MKQHTLRELLDLKPIKEFDSVDGKNGTLLKMERLTEKDWRCINIYVIDTQKNLIRTS